MDIDFYQHYAHAAEAARGPAWCYDERKPCGFHYDNFLLARVYDTHHQRFRDYRQETEQIVGLLGRDPFATVIDMGCGTGAFAIHAAPCYHRIHAVDVSQAMLRRARRKARKAGASNVEFHHAGFLTYEHEGPPADAAVSVAALHHLPDFWKLVGLHRLAAMLKPNARFYLFDVVFSFDIAQYESAADQFVRRMSTHMGPNGRVESEIHLRSEFSTCNWIMEGLLERAGFQIEAADYKNDFLAGYVCTKRSEAVRAKSLTVADQQLR